MISECIRFLLVSERPVIQIKKKMLLLIIFMAILSITLVTSNVTPTPTLQNRLQGLEKAEKEQVLKLEVYEAAGKDIQDLASWFCMTEGLEKTSADEDLKKLKAESCREGLHSAPGMSTGLISMCDAYDEAFTSATCPGTNLDIAECIAIYMYTSEFYSTYNPNIRKGYHKPYKIFTSILYKALSKFEPLPNNTILYRGLDKKFDIDAKGRFYFKQFVSTSTDEEVANLFGKETTIVIAPSVPLVAAKLENLSKYPGEEEVLISPFEAFEFINKTGNKLFFKSSRSQDFLGNSNLTCLEDKPVKVTSISTTSLPIIKQTAESVISAGHYVSGYLHVFTFSILFFVSWF